MRLQKSIDFKRELKALRRALVEFTARREKLRQEFRRKAVSKELMRIASAGDLVALDTDANFFASSQSSMGLGSTQRTMRLPDVGASPNRAKRTARFDFGRFGADAMHSPSVMNTMRSGSSTKTLLPSTTASAPSL